MNSILDICNIESEIYVNNIINFLQLTLTGENKGAHTKRL